MIKIFKASNYYQEFYDNFYSENEDVDSISYSSHIERVFNRCFGESNFFKINCEKDTTVKFEEVVSGDFKLQTKWAKENKMQFNSDDWFFEILEAQLLNFRPNVFFAHHHKALLPKFINRLKKIIPELKLIISWDGSGQNNIELFSIVNILFTPADYITNFYLSKGIKAHTLKFAFENSILNQLKKDSTANAVFTGSISMSSGGHRDRLELLHHLQLKEEIDLYLSGSVDISNNILTRKTLSLMRFNRIFDVYKLYTLGKVSKGSVFGIDMYNVLFNSKITINIHEHFVLNSANMRLYESTGVGSCLLTDYKPDISQLFEVDKEIVVYKSKEECAEKLSFLLRNDNVREEIALAGQKRTLENYNYRNRSLLFLDIINQNL